jgi:hypothetical protein
MYGDLYAQRNSQNALPAPSSRGARMLDHQQVKAAEYMSSTPSVNFQQVSPIKRALKISPVVKTRLAPQPASPKPRSKLAEEPSFVEDMIVAEEIYQQKKYEDVPMTMVKAPGNLNNSFVILTFLKRLFQPSLFFTCQLWRTSSITMIFTSLPLKQRRLRLSTILRSFFETANTMMTRCSTISGRSPRTFSAS